MRAKEFITETTEYTTMTAAELAQAEKDGLIPNYWEADDYDPNKKPEHQEPLKRYYHGTTLENAKKILKTGLDPKYTYNSGEHAKGYVFLAHTIKGAEDFAPGGIYGYKNKIGAILEINLPVNAARKIRTDLGEFLRCPFRIPPQFIRIVKYTNKTKDRFAKS